MALGTKEGQHIERTIPQMCCPNATEKEKREKNPFNRN
jgi:hypothetical protein